MYIYIYTCVSVIWKALYGTGIGNELQLSNAPHRNWAADVTGDMEGVTVTHTLCQVHTQAYPWYPWGLIIETATGINIMQYTEAKKLLQT